MKKILFLLLITGSLFSQWHIITNKTDGFRLLYNQYGGEVNLTTLTNPSRWTDTTMPLTAYTDGYVYLNGKGSMMHMSRNPFIDLRFNIVDSFRIIVDYALASTPKASSYLVGSYDPALGGWWIRYGNNYGPNTLEFYRLGTPSGTRLICNTTPGDTTRHSAEIRWRKSDSTMTMYLDGVLQNTYTGIYFSNNVSTKTYGMCVGNQIELTGITDYSDAFTYGNTSTLYRGKIYSFLFSKNDTAYNWDFNQGNTQNFFPTRKIHNVNSVPYYPYENVDRFSTDSTSAGAFIIQNGASHGVDTMDAVIYRGAVKSGYRDPFNSLSSLAGFENGIAKEDFGGESFVYNGTLYNFGNFNAGNDSGALRTGYDSLKGVTKWNPLTRKHEQLGYGLITASGASSTMFGFGFNDKIIACGYDITAVGVGTVNYVAQYDTSTGLWSAMGTGLNNVGFSGGSAYGLAYIGFFGDSAYGSTGKKNKIVKWTGSAWDSLRGGLFNGVPLCMFPDSSDGTRKLIVGGYFDSYKQGGTTTTNVGLAVWNEDTDTWSKFNNISVTPGKGVYKVLKNVDWYYFFGDFDWITNGTDTIRSYGMARWKSGVGLQGLGTGIYMNNTTATSITSAVILNDILYIGGSFSRVNGMLSNNFGAINLITGTLIDVGFGTDMRMEGLCIFNGKIIGIGDNFHINGKFKSIVFEYDPLLNIP